MLFFLQAMQHEALQQLFLHPTALRVALECVVSRHTQVQTSAAKHGEPAFKEILVMADSFACLAATYEICGPCSQILPRAEARPVRCISFTAEVCR